MNESYGYLEDRLQKKLLMDLREEKLNIEEYRVISRGLASVLNPMLLKELRELRETQ